MTSELRASIHWTDAHSGECDEACLASPLAANMSDVSVLLNYGCAAGEYNELATLLLGG